MTMKTEDFEKMKIGSYDEYSDLTLEIVGQKDAKTKKGEPCKILVCKLADGTEVGLFDWALRLTGDGRIQVLKRHMDYVLARRKSSK